METVTLILPLEATTDINLSDSSGVKAVSTEGATASVTAGGATSEVTSGELIE